jgi:hypothetical protein
LHQLGQLGFELLLPFEKFHTDCQGTQGEGAKSLQSDFDEVFGGANDRDGAGLSCPMLQLFDVVARVAMV